MDTDKQQELLIANLILPLIKDLVLPKIEPLFKQKIVDNDKKKSFEENITEYLNQKYLKVSFIDTITFGSRQTLFDVLYEPLTLESKTGTRSYLIDSFPIDLFRTHFRIVLEDTAGMGKSTVITKIFKTAIEEKLYIPVLIPLRHINEKNSIFTEIYNQFTLANKDLTENEIDSFLTKSNFVFLFDGFDEISTADKSFTIRNLSNFIDRFNWQFFIIASRPEAELSKFGSFEKYNIKPLEKKESYNLLERYDYYSYKKISNQLIEQIEISDIKNLSSFLSNPLLTSLLYKTYDYKNDIPLKKTLFYRQVYEALFDQHDLMKEGHLKRNKYTNLHSDDFERVIRYVSYLTSIQNVTEFETDYILNIIEDTKGYNSDLQFKSSDMLKDLLTTVPLFKRDGNHIKWMHKSLQDYFSAKFIWVDESQDQTAILDKIYKDNNNEKFSNILDLFSELAPTIFEKNIVFRILKEFKLFADNKFQKFSTLPNTIYQQLVENNFNRLFRFSISRRPSIESKFNIIEDEIYLNLEYTSDYTEFENYLDESLVSTKLDDLIGNFVLTTEMTYIKTNLFNIMKLPYMNENKLVKTLKFYFSALNDSTRSSLAKELYIIDATHLDDIREDLLNYNIIVELTSVDIVISFERALIKLQELEVAKNSSQKNKFINW